MERRAYICNHKSHGDLPQRVFVQQGEPEPPKCSDNHVMIRQPNRSYMTGKQKKGAKK